MRGLKKYRKEIDIFEFFYSMMETKAALKTLLSKSELNLIKTNTRIDKKLLELDRLGRSESESHNRLINLDKKYQEKGIEVEEDFDYNE